MEKVNAINFKAQPFVQPAKTDKSVVSQNHVSVDLTKIYKQEEIVDILKEVGTYKGGIYPTRYTMELCDDSIIINNHNMTNDTTCINADGSVRHCGSWHNNEIAPKGTYTHVVENVKARFGRCK